METQRFKEKVVFVLTKIGALQGDRETVCTCSNVHCGSQKHDTEQKNQNHQV
jgi:hypothetical protein